MPSVFRVQKFTKQVQCKNKCWTGKFQNSWKRNLKKTWFNFWLGKGHFRTEAAMKVLYKQSGGGIYVVYIC